MPRKPHPLRDTIARSILESRKERFPGRGGSKRCAEAFSQCIGKTVSQQQWSQWERGLRTPREARLEQMAKFFGKNIDRMRQDNRPPDHAASSPPTSAKSVEASSYLSMSTPELLLTMGREGVKAVYQVEITVSAVRFIPSRASGRKGGGVSPV